MYDMNMLQMFDHVPWSTRFLKLYLFSRGLQNPVVHPLCEATQSDTSIWFSKRSNSKQWLDILRMIEEEGPLLFVGGVGSLAMEG